MLHKQLYYLLKITIILSPLPSNKTSTNSWFLGDNPIGPLLISQNVQYDRVLQNTTSISLFWVERKANVPCQIASVFVV